MRYKVDNLLSILNKAKIDNDINYIDILKYSSGELEFTFHDNEFRISIMIRPEED
jgi:hypothetical protein